MRNKESYRALLQSIHRCNSLTAIDLTVERNLADTTLSEQQRTDLEQIARLTSIDVIHIFTAEKLGLHEEAERIKAFLRRKAAQKPNVAAQELQNSLLSDLDRKVA
jgi:hypothetical protein